MKSTRKVVIVIISRQNVEIKCYVSLSLMNDIFLISIKKVNWKRTLQLCRRRRITCLRLKKMRLAYKRQFMDLATGLVYKLARKRIRPTFSQYGPHASSITSVFHTDTLPIIQWYITWLVQLTRSQFVHVVIIFSAVRCGLSGEDLIWFFLVYSIFSVGIFTSLWKGKNIWMGKFLIFGVRTKLSFLCFWKCKSTAIFNYDMPVIWTHTLN